MSFLILGTCYHWLVYSGAWDPQMAGTAGGGFELVGIVGKQSRAGSRLGGIFISSLPATSWGLWMGPLPIYTMRSDPLRRGEAFQF